MNPEDIFKQTGDAYLYLIHPESNEENQNKIGSVVALASTVPAEIIAKMILGGSWRERLLGICMTLAKNGVPDTESILQSLGHPRGIAIVPACAALAVLAQEGCYAMTKSFGEMFDRQILDGEIGWAADNAMRFAGVINGNIEGRGPNYGQVFENHAALYHWVRKAI